MEEKNNSNGWHEVERAIFDKEDYTPALAATARTRLELHLKGKAARLEDLAEALSKMQEFLDFRSLKDETGNPYAGNWLMVGELNDDWVRFPRILRRLDDFASLRYATINGWFSERIFDEPFEWGDEIESILDVNGKLIFKDASSGKRFEIRQLTGKGNKLIEEVSKNNMFIGDGDQTDLEPNEPDGWHPYCEIHTPFEALGKSWGLVWDRDDDVFGFLEALWNSPEHCQRPRYMQRMFRDLAYEFEREIDGKMQSVQVKETPDDEKASAFYVMMCFDDQPAGNVDRFETPDDALAFCKERYGIEVDG